MEPISLATIDDETNEGMALTAVADYVDRKYKIPFDQVVRDYAGVSRQLGLPESATAAYGQLKGGSKELQERAGRVRKRYDQGPIEKRARGAVAAVSQITGTLVGGMVRMMQEQGKMAAPMGLRNTSYAPQADFSKSVDKVSDLTRRAVDASGVTPEFQNSLEGKVYQGLASTLPMVISPQTIAPMLVGEVISDAEAMQGVSYSEMSDEQRERVDNTMAAYLPLAIVAERLPIELTILRGVVKEGAGKSTQVVANILAAASAEAVTERTQSKTLDVLASKIQKDGRDVWEADTLMGAIAEFYVDEETLVAAIVGGSFRGGIEATGALYSKFLDPEGAATAEDFKALEKNATDEEIRATVEAKTGDPEAAELAVKATHGDEAARKQYIEKTTIDPADDPVAALELTEEEAAAGFAEATEQAGQSEDFYRGLYPEQFQTPEDVKKTALAEMVDYFNEIALDGSTLEQVDDVRTFEDQLNEMRDAGMTEAEVERFAFEKIQAAGQNLGRDLSGIDRRKLQIFGSNETSFKRGVFKDATKLYRGASAETVIEEKVHGFTDRAIALGEMTWEDVRQWKQVTDGESSGTETESDLREWLGQQGIAWMVGNSKKMESEGAMPSSFRQFLEQALEYFQHVFRQAARLNGMRRRGELPSDFESFLDRSTGQDMEFLMDQLGQKSDNATASENTVELMEAIGGFAGLPRPDGDPTFKAELEQIWESFGKDWRRYPKKARSLDRMREELKEKGFNFDTPAELLDALDAASRGEKIMGGEVFEGQGGPSFSMAPAELAELAKSAQRFGGVGFKGKRPAKLYRGVKESGEAGASSYGVGLYTTADKKQASIYGDVVEMNPVADLPQNPAYFDSVNDWETWLGNLTFDKLGLNRAYKLEAEVGSINKIISSMGADGVQIGKGKDAFFVKYPPSSEVSFSMAPELQGSRAQPDGDPAIIQGSNGVTLTDSISFSIGAFHGTPHKVDKFKTEKIGTGEGAQAYGYGLYFTDTREVAEDYRKRLAGGSTKGEKTTEEKARWFLDRYGKNEAVLRLKQIIDTTQQRIAAGWSIDSKEVKQDEQVLSALESLDESSRNPGNLYTVELDVEPEQLLDWDKPLGEQSEQVRAALGFPEGSIVQGLPVDPDGDLGEWEGGEVPTGASIYGQQVIDMGTNEEASEALASLGIKGIRYLDGASRGEGEGSYNYVIFDESAIKITEENGQPVTVEEAMPSISFNMAPMDRPLYSSQNVKGLRSAKSAWLSDGASIESGREIVSSYYQTASFAGIPKDATLVPMPSTGGTNILPDILAERIAEDFGQPVERRRVATATAKGEAKNKRTFFDKESDPVGYEPNPDVINDLRGKTVFITEDVHNTGESWIAFARMLIDSGVNVEGVATLVSTEQRMTSSRDMERISEKISTHTGIEIDKVKPAIESLFNGSFKQLANKAEADVTRSAGKARKLYEIAASGRRAGAYSNPLKDSRSGQSSLLGNQQDLGLSFSMGILDEDSGPTVQPRERTPEEQELAQELRKFRNDEWLTDSQRNRINKTPADGRTKLLEQFRKDKQRELKVLSTKAIESRKRQRLQQSNMKKLDEEVRKRVDAIRRMAEERESLTDAISLLETLVRNLPLPVRGKFQGFETLAKRTTDAGKRAYIENATRRIEKIFADSDKRQAQQRVFKRVRNLESQISEAKAGKRKLSFNSDKVEAFLKSISYSKASQVQAMRDKISELEKRMEDSAGSDNLDVRALADEVQALTEQLSRKSLFDPDITGSELRQIEKDLTALVTEGRTEREALIDERREQAREAAIAIIEELGAVDESTLTDKERDLLRIAKDFGGGLLRPETITEILTGSRDSELKRAVFEPLFQAEQQKVEAIELMHEKLDKIFDSVDVRAAENERNVLIEIEGVPFSLDEAMAVYAYSQNERGAAHLDGTTRGKVRLNAETRAEIIAAIPAEAKAAVDSIINYNDGEQYDRMATVFFKETGAVLPKENRYFPIRNLNRSNSHVDLLMDYMDAGAKLNKGMTKGRTGSATGFQSLSFFEAAVKGALAAEHYIAYAEALRSVNAVLNYRNKDVGVNLADTMEARNKTLNKELRGWVSDVANGRIREGQRGLDRGINWLRRNSTIALLGFNIGTAFKQPASFFPALKRGDTASIMHQLIRFADPSEAVKMVKFARSKSPFLRARASNLNTELAERAQQGETAKLLGSETLFRKFQDLSLAPLKFIDGMVATVVWTGQYRSVLNKTGNEAEAMRAADELVRQTQSTGDLINSARLYRSGGLTKALFAFTTDLNQVLNLALSDAKTESGLHKRAASVGLYYVMPALWMAAATLARDEIYELIGIKDDDEEALEDLPKDIAGEFVGQVLGPVPLLSAPAQGVAFTVMGDKRAFYMGETDIAAFSGLNEIGRGKLENAAYGTAMVLGVPGVPQVKRLINVILED
jgi:hypothetical protein